MFTVVLVNGGDGMAPGRWAEVVAVGEGTRGMRVGGFLS